MGKMKTRRGRGRAYNTGYNAGIILHETSCPEAQSFPERSKDANEVVLLSDSDDDSTFEPSSKNVSNSSRDRSRLQQNRDDQTTASQPKDNLSSEKLNRRTHKMQRPAISDENSEDLGPSNGEELVISGHEEPEARATLSASCKVGEVSPIISITEDVKESQNFTEEKENSDSEEILIQGGSFSQKSENFDTSRSSVPASISEKSTEGEKNQRLFLEVNEIQQN